MPFVGLSIRSQVDSEGMLILLVNSESPCFNAGLKPGDVLVSIEGQPVNNIKDYRRIMNEAAIQRGLAIIEVAVVRDGEKRVFNVQIKV